MRKAIYKVAVTITSALILLNLVCSNGTLYSKAQNRKQAVLQNKNKPTKDKRRKTKGVKHVRKGKPKAKQTPAKKIDTFQDFAPKTELTAEHDGWRLILVNYDHPVADDYIDNVPLKIIREGQTEHKVDERIFDDLQQMLEDAKNDGIDLRIRSAHRSKQCQKVFFDSGVKARMNEGMKREEAEQETATWIARPGTSEHHTGLAIDIVTPSHQELNEGFGKTDAARWLAQHVDEYGGILPYTEANFHKTHVHSEPWHVRMVGKDLAPLIKASGLSYEEYYELYLAPIFQPTNQAEKAEHLR
ncbi:hypothetical protein FACS189481_1920 [Clostridia bacterium]|nr:hypothetical protein FACS189481_1920 [Clostridia bacterium]